MGAACRVGWRAWKLQDLVGTGLGGPFAAWGTQAQGTIGPKSWEGMSGGDIKGELASWEDPAFGVAGS